MNNWKKACLGGLLALSLNLPALAAETITNARQPIVLNQVERDFLLTEMHLNMTALRSVFAAIVDKDAKRAQEAALSRGMATFGDKDPTRPKTLTAKLPQGWKAMAAAGRQGFDELAAGLAAQEDSAQSLTRLGKLFDNCNACHLSFRLELQP